MKLNNKGFAISSIMYIILIFAMVLIMAILGMLSSRKIVLDKIKNKTKEDINNNLANIRYYVGDKIKVNDEYYYVIADSPRNKDYVTALKEYPLTVDEVNLYGGVGTENNYVNKYTSDSVGTASNQNGYGGVAYYSSPTCGYVDGSENSGCEGENATNYASSHVKYIVDDWAMKSFNQSQLKRVNGYSARLIGYSELIAISEEIPNQSSQYRCKYDWMFSSNYAYWVMNSYYSSEKFVWNVPGDGIFRAAYVFGEISVRPVINVYKSVIKEE